MVERALNTLATIAPDALETVHQRFSILKLIAWLEPVGRRILADQLQITERMLRTETDYLKKLGLLEVTKSGMSLSAQGQKTYHELALLFHELGHTSQKEQELATYLGIERCFILPGNCVSGEELPSYYGQLVTELLDDRLPQGKNYIVVMGGTTMAAVAKSMGRLESTTRHNCFLPARGGVGERGTIQANMVCERMAEQTGGSYRTLYVPEQVSEHVYPLLLQEPSVQEVIGLMQQASVVIHSIGDALTMARRRQMPEALVNQLLEKDAVSESFGYFFDSQGEIVYKIPRIGVQLAQLKDMATVLAIATGQDKAEAMTAYMHHAPYHTWLITDEGAAQQILRGQPL